VGKVLRCRFCSAEFRVGSPEDLGVPSAAKPEVSTRSAILPECTQADERVKGLESEVQRLGAELTEKAASHALVLAQLQESLQEVARTQEQSARYQRQLAQIPSSEAVVARLGEELKAAGSRHQDLEAQLQALDPLRRQLDELQRERDDLGRSSNAERERLQASFQEEQRVKLEEADVRWQTELARLREEHESLRHDHDRALAEAASSDRESNLQELEASRARLVQLERDQGERERAWQEEKQRLLADAEEKLRAHSMQLEARLQDDLAQLRDQHAALILERDRLKQDADDQRAEAALRLQSREAAWNEESHCKAEIHEARLKELEDGLRAEMAELQSLLTSTQQEREQAFAKADCLNQELQQYLQDRAEERQRHEAEWHAQSREQEELVQSRHQEELARLQAGHEERLLGLQESRNQVEEQHAALAAVHDRLQKELVLLVAEYEAVKNQAARHQQELNHLEEDRAQVMQDWIARMQNEHQEQFRLAEHRFEASKERQAQEAEVLRQELQAAQLDLAAAREEMETLKTEKHGNTQSTRKMQTTLIRFEEERQALQSEVEHFRKEAEALRQWREGTRKEIEALWKERDALVACREEFDKHKKDLEGLRQERDDAVQQLQDLKSEPAHPEPSRVVAKLALFLGGCLLGSAGAAAVCGTWLRWYPW
jgi:hypothetical protein